MWDTLIIHATLATMAPGGAPYGLVPDGAVAFAGGRIAFAGSTADLPGPPDSLAREVVDAGGRLVTPGLVDCHTHLVFAGDRAAEFEERLNGISYEEIARRGGGIASTVRATREAGEDELLGLTLARARRLMAEGVTTVEIKSGYGLDVATEMRCLRVARQVGERLPIDVATTYLGAHAIPPEFKGRADDYVSLVVEEALPAIADAGLADAVDAFVEGIAFSPEQGRRVFAAARARGLAVKLHADQLSKLGGARLSAEFGALSADHVEYTDAAGVAAMAAAGTVAVVLPGAFYTLRETQAPPIAAFRAAGVPIAVATDMNPGSSPLISPLMTLNMACTLFRLTPEEALAGMTRVAARALGRDDIGMLVPGHRADVALWSARRPAELAYWMGIVTCDRLWKGGRGVEGEAR